DCYLEMFIDVWRNMELKRILNNAQIEDWPIVKIQQSLDRLEDIQSAQDLSVKYERAKLYELPFRPMEQKPVVPTVIPDLEKLIEGFHCGDVTIIAARPSMGKTDVMNHLALHAGWAGYLPIIFSLEMNKSSLTSRMIATAGKINRNKLRNPYHYFSDEQRDKWPQLVNRINDSDIYIDDTPGMSVNHIRAKARKIIKSNPTKKPIIFIDYLQIIYSENQSNLTNKIGELSWAIKKMAKELNCPVVCLSQLNRGVEGRQNKRPVLSDLRDSGN